MLTENQILENKIKFLKLIEQINIPGANTAELVEYLDNGGFFEAPASTNYHNNYKGGLCEHSLNVYYQLCNLYELYKNQLPYEYEPSTLIVCGLLHDISKTNYYELYAKNEKYYHEDGKKHDNGGSFDWVVVDGYKVKDSHDRFLCGTHEENSVYLVARFIPLMEEEYVAILNHHAGLGQSNQNYDSSAIANRYPLQPLLHAADYLSTFIMERAVK